MSAIALIGSDGAGKTSVAEALVASSDLPLKYIYMGVNVESSNIALPTSRLIHRVKVMEYRRTLRRRGEEVPAIVTLHGVEHRSDRRGKLGATLRLLRRISEESYRQLWSWIYHKRGWIVIYDRHFVFDALPRPSTLGANRRLTDRIHNWFLHRVFPRPDLTILLATSPEVLYNRKQEVPVDYLAADQEALRAKGHAYSKAFAEVDAAQPFDSVVATVSDLIADHLAAVGSHD